MVAYNQTTEDRRQETEETQDSDVTVDCVCPKCFRPLPGARIFPQEDRYGRQIRKYLGFCLGCNLGCEVVQFHRDDRWLIHKYQYYKPVGVTQHCRGSGEWNTINDMPEPAPVVTGPGGEFDKQITPKIDSTCAVELLKKLRQEIEGLYQAIECLIRGPGL